MCVRTRRLTTSAMSRLTPQTCTEASLTLGVLFMYNQTDLKITLLDRATSNIPYLWAMGPHLKRAVNCLQATHGALMLKAA